MILKGLLISTLGAGAFASSPQNLPDVLKSNSKLSIFSSLLQSKPDYVEAFASYQNTTCFIPQNEAFNGFPTGDGLGEVVDVGTFLNYSCIQGTIFPSFDPNGSVFRSYLTNSSVSRAPTGGQVVLGFYDGEEEYIYSGLSLNAIVAALNIKTGPLQAPHDPYIQKSKILPSNDETVFAGGIIVIIDALLSPPVHNLSTVATILNNTAIMTGVTANLFDPTLFEADDITLVTTTNNYMDIVSIEIQNQNRSAAEWAQIREYSFSNTTAAYPNSFSTNPAGTLLPTQLGRDLTMRKINGSLWLDWTEVVQWNVLLPNGIMYITDGLIEPQSES